MSVDMLLIQSCSPTLCGIKPASLLSLNKDDFQRERNNIRNLSQSLGVQGKSVVTLCRLDKKILIFLFDKELLRSRLEDKAVQDYLKTKGYSQPQIFTRVLGTFLKRLMTSQNFPHESGVFLGYPLEDVIAFEKQPNYGYKFCGTWKAYFNEEYARRMSKTYSECKSLCGRWYSQGNSIPNVIKKYSRLKQRLAV